MKKEDLIKDRIYYIVGNYPWLIKFKEINNDGAVISDGSLCTQVGSPSWHSLGVWGQWSNVKEIREATDDEVRYYYSSKTNRRPTPVELINYSIY